jgi:hypothetical protein
MTLVESFPSRADATLHALRQQATYPGCRVLISGTAGGFTVTTTINHAEQP